MEWSEYMDYYNCLRNQLNCEYAFCNQGICIKKMQEGYAQVEKTVKKDELLQAYTRAYKAHYARMTKPRKKAANMSREEFEAWYKEAKEGLEMARQGKLDPEAYKAWLKK